MLDLQPTFRDPFQILGRERLLLVNFRVRLLVDYSSKAKLETLDL